MVKHIIVWKFKEALNNKIEQAAAIKTALEGLVGKIDGLQEMHILTERFDCSSGDIMMDSTFVSKAALDGYQKHPLHQEIANGLVCPVMEQRLSFDYEI
ncbi:MAG: Dabb family protein [Clostridiales bacterium]|nr:Dabb family protein [Clostridiales bacterium]